MQTIKTVFEWALRALQILSIVITLVERPGDGPAKRAEATTLFREALEQAGAPAWVLTVFARESFVGWLIDLLVAAANATGFFGRTEETPSA